MQEPLKQLTHEIRSAIKLRNKKQSDISDLIQGYDISGEDLSSSYISDLNLSGRTITDVNFTGAKMKFQFQKGIARNCVFITTNFLDGSSIRFADMRTCSFRGMYAPDLDFAGVDWRGCDVCGCVIPWFSRKCHGAKLDKNFLKQLSKYLNIEGLEKNDNI